MGHLETEDRRERRKEKEEEKAGTGRRKEEDQTDSTININNACIVGWRRAFFSFALPLLLLSFHHHHSPHDNTCTLHTFCTATLLLKACRHGMPCLRKAGRQTVVKVGILMAWQNSSWWHFAPWQAKRKEKEEGMCKQLRRRLPSGARAARARLLPPCVACWLHGSLTGVPGQAARDATAWHPARHAWLDMQAFKHVPILHTSLPALTPDYSWTGRTHATA